MVSFLLLLQILEVINLYRKKKFFGLTVLEILVHDRFKAGHHGGNVAEQNHSSHMGQEARESKEEAALHNTLQGHAPNNLNPSR